MRHTKIILSALTCIIFTAGAANAQEFFDVDQLENVDFMVTQDGDILQNAEDISSEENASMSQENPYDTQEGAMPNFSLDGFPSLMFTYWEQASILDAKNSRGLTRAPTDTELFEDLNSDQTSPEESPGPPPGIRTLELGGIAFKTSKSWTIWLNGERVTPTALPAEVLDLKVYKEYIELKWLDEYRNQIVPIRLRPHQRFNIDQRIFLPG